MTFDEWLKLSAEIPATPEYTPANLTDLLDNVPTP